MNRLFSIIFALICLLYLPPPVFSATANITQINFVTKEQSVEPSTISKVFTVQTQNSAGQMEVVDETSDLILSIDSNTAEFNSNNTTWNPATTFTMSKNTGNKNFYYKDITEGTHTIKAIIKGRTTGKSWEASQAVFVGETVIIDPTPATSTNATSTDSGANSGQSSTTSSISTHYIQEVISVYVEPTVFELTAGRDRLGYLGSPLEFRAVTKLSGDLKNSHCSFLWSFGDGYSAKGESVKHIYEEIGDYNLTVNGDCDDFYAIDRLRVRIIKPEVLISSTSDNQIKIKNDLDTEFNLYTLKLISGRDEFDFPQDTIIDGRGELVLSNKLLKFTPNSNVKLVDYSGHILAELYLVAGASYSVEPVELISAMKYLKELDLINY